TAKINADAPVEERRKREGGHPWPVVPVVITWHVIESLPRGFVAGAPAGSRGPSPLQQTLDWVWQATGDGAKRDVWRGPRLGNPRLSRRIPAVVLVQDGQAIRGRCPSRRHC